jgi:hypothetical protein
LLQVSCVSLLRLVPAIDMQTWWTDRDDQSSVHCNGFRP